MKIHTCVAAAAAAAAAAIADDHDDVKYMSQTEPALPNVVLYHLGYLQDETCSL